MRSKQSYTDLHNLWRTLSFTVLQTNGMLSRLTSVTFIPPILQNYVKDPSLQTIPQQLISCSVFFLCRTRNCPVKITHTQFSYSLDANPLDLRLGQDFRLKKQFAKNCFSPLKFIVTHENTKHLHFSHRDYSPLLWRICYDSSSSLSHNNDDDDGD